jgi:hypothetical protein
VIDLLALLAAGAIGLVLIGLIGPRLLPDPLDPHDDESATP